MQRVPTSQHIHILLFTTVPTVYQLATGLVSDVSPTWKTTRILAFPAADLKKKLHFTLR
jgi:hypothetical protein